MAFRPLFLAVPAALVAAAGLAWMTSASAFNGGFESGPQVAQAAPPAAVPPAAGGGATVPGARPERPAFSPQKMCIEKVARRIGNRAYLKARLDLKPEQMQAWSTFEKVADDVSAKDKARCASLPTEIKTRPDFAERFAMRESMMKQRSESLTAVKPSLLALYSSLTPEQKQIVDGPVMGGGRFHHGRRDRG
jgi:LTXXQ motif family protein